MIDFKPVTIDDKEVMEPYLKKNPYNNCDFSFTSIFMWRKKYKTHYAIVDGFLVLSSKDGYFLMPIGQGDIKEVIIKLCRDAKEKNLAPVFAAVTPDGQELFQRYFPGMFEFVKNRDWDDYIYLSEDLIHLKGKKFHAKRNHINKFESLHSGYECIVPQKEDMEECFEVYKKWCVESYGTYDPETDESIAVREALSNFEKLTFCSMAIKAEGKIVAFSLGQPINDEVFGVHIEKALRDYGEAYAVINRCFAQSCASGFKFINREEDMGIEGLRKAKLSYNPVVVLEKSFAVLRGEL